MKFRQALFSLVLIVGFAFYVMLYSSRQSAGQVAVNEPSPSIQPSVIPSPVSSPVTSPAKSPSRSPAASPPSPSPSASPAGQFKDGTYNGPVTDAYFGNYQVAAVISGGKLTDVTFLKYPNDQLTSRSINQNAMPKLKQEAIAKQSAQVDIVSGATQSSQAFQQSLAAALNAARI